MAFNPLANFQKYKKIWMATIILLCMVVFVFCGGMGGGSRDEGGLGGFLRRLFRSRGEVLASIDGTNYYKEDFDTLKENREMANKFMRYFLENCAKQVEVYMKNPEELRKYAGEVKLDPKMEQNALVFHYAMFKEKLKQPRYFEGTYKLPDLAAHRAWLNEADKQGIDLTDDMLNRMVYEMGYVYLPNPEEKQPIRVPLVGPETFAAISRKVRAENRAGRDVTDARLIQAVRDEFRVLIAQMMIYKSPPSELDFILRGGKNMNDLVPRVLLTPEQIFQYFRKYRTAFDLTLVPVSAETLSAQVRFPGEEALEPFLGLHKALLGRTPFLPLVEDKLAAFFEEHKKDVEDPASEKIGLKYPTNRFMVHFLMADPESERFRKRAEEKLALTMALPVAWNPMMPPWMTYLHLPLHEELKGRLVDQWIEENRSKTVVREKFAAGRTGDQDYALHLLAWLGRNDPHGQAGMANLVAVGLGDPSAFFIAPEVFARQALKEDADPKGKRIDRLPDWTDQQIFDHELARQVERETRERLPVYVTAVSLADNPLTSLAPAFALGEPYKTDWIWDINEEFRRKGIPLKEKLPIIDLQPWTTHARKVPARLYLQEEWDKLVHQEAAAYAREAMIEARKKLTRVGVAGEKGRLAIELRDVLPIYGLNHVSSKKPYTLREMEAAKELEPLRKAFEKEALTIDSFEGRRGDKRLVEKSFASALFFTGGEKHSVAGQPYAPKAWPPDLEVPHQPEVVEMVRKYLQGTQTRLDEAVAMKLEFGDPLAGKGEVVDLFEKSETPLLFWREDAPKEEVLRWIPAIRKARDEEVARKSSPEDKKAALLKYDREEKQVRQRTIDAAKRSIARSELIFEEAKRLATKLAEDGAGPMPGQPYRAALESLLPVGHDLIEVPQVAPWYPRKKEFTGLEYQDFAVPREVAFPRDDMAKNLLGLPALEAALTVDHKDTDELNKSLYSLSQKAFERLRKDAFVPGTQDKKARIVQIIPNKPKSVYYVTLLTEMSPTPFDLIEKGGGLGRWEEFLNAMGGRIRLPGDAQDRQDPFLARVYEEAAKDLHKKVHEDLVNRHRIVIRDTQAAKAYETDTGG